MAHDYLKTGGPAFPVTSKDEYGQPVLGADGMSLRDWFAGQALAGLMSRGVYSSTVAASMAYDAARAMLDMKAYYERGE